jgi:orotate phosphoribosyltransferase
MTVTPTLDPLFLDVRRGDPSLVRDFLGRPGVLEHGHYALLSGRHSDTFIRFSMLARDESALGCIADWLVPSLKPWEADAIVAPATAGVALGWALARRLSVPLHLAAPDATGRPTAIGTSDDLNTQRVLLVNDVVTTGAGMKALARVAEAADADIAGAAWFATRSPVDVEAIIAARATWVVGLELAAVEAEVCELCQQKIPVEHAVDLN